MRCWGVSDAFVPLGGGPRQDPGHAGWKHLRVPLGELEEVTRARYTLTSLLRLLPP